MDHEAAAAEAAALGQHENHAGKSNRMQSTNRFRDSLLLFGTCAILGAVATFLLSWNDREPLLVAAGAIPSGVAAGISAIVPPVAGVIATAGVVVGFAFVAVLRPDPGSATYPLDLNLLWVTIWVFPVALVTSFVGWWASRSSRVA